MERELVGGNVPDMREVKQCVWGVSAAVLCTLLLRENSLKVSLPFLFIGIVSVVAMRFGSTPGILGTLAAAPIVKADWAWKGDFTGMSSDCRATREGRRLV